MAPDEDSDPDGDVAGRSEPRRRYLVSGASSGIGRAALQLLSARGHAVWGTSTTAEGARSVLQAGATGASVCDVSRPVEVDAAVDEACDALGGLDGVFVNAGMDGTGRPALDADISHVLRVLEVNVVGALVTASAAVRAFPGPGAVVFCASMNALRPEPNFVDYNASKAAVVSVARTMALELAPKGVWVTAVCPGYVPTRMTEPYLSDDEIRADILSKVPAGRLATGAEVAGLVDFLLSPAASYMTGAVVPIDGGTHV